MQGHQRRLKKFPRRCVHFFLGVLCTSMSILIAIDFLSPLRIAHEFQSPGKGWCTSAASVIWTHHIYICIYFTVPFISFINNNILLITVKSGYADNPKWLINHEMTRVLMCYVLSCRLRHVAVKLLHLGVTFQKNKT